MIDQSDNNDVDEKVITNLRVIEGRGDLPSQSEKRDMLASIVASSWDATHSDILRVVLNHVSEAILTMDLEGRIELVNPVAAHLLGVSANEMVGRPWWNFLGRSYREEYRAIFSDWRTDPANLPHFGPKEALLTRQDGSFVEVDLSLSGIPSAEPKVIAVLHDLTTHKAEYRELRRLARTDSLTGLANRRAFDEVLARHWRECNHSGVPLSVIMLDVDYFKRFNDEHGHQQGDYCLGKIAAAIEEQLPSKRCLAARYGGEEFAVILPGCTAAVAQNTALEIQRAVQKLRFEDQGLPESARVTVSQGIAGHRGQQFRTSSALLSGADTALYHAKVSGRNQVVLCPYCPEP